MSKPTVRYSDIGRAEVGQRCSVCPIEHPTCKVPPGFWVETSTVVRVVRHWRGPIVETKNTLYIPAVADPEDTPEIMKDRRAVTS